ncbi:DUF2269 domain-containing protein [Streptomyces netropsis]|uniref:Putative membrane protein n=1 Tax=Streptomyces netropsis TaxID=55404 RepID=A0A7W7LDS3_STRNE|nr:DUF2269 domain-containing protein [Streptomyces netropsis]MBB4887771.1 putative membrane protein [Streptomyces netropsis]GGR47708.1 hypothetical protein GCM10010219_61390 [Streptomyces netropsis]
MRQLTRPARRGILVVHVVTSVGWLGLTLGLLVLGITGATTASPQTQAAVYRSMKLFGDWLIIPLSLSALVSGLVLSLGTPWGLARHRWVYLKFWLTLGATLASALSLRPALNEAAASVATGDGVAAATSQDLLAAPIVSLSLYVFMTAISVLKPWGLTARGRRHRAARRTAGARTTAGVREAGAPRTPAVHDTGDQPPSTASIADTAKR